MQSQFSQIQVTQYDEMRRDATFWYRSRCLCIWILNTSFSQNEWTVTTMLFCKLKRNHIFCKTSEPQRKPNWKEETLFIELNILNIKQILCYSMFRIHSLKHCFWISSEENSNQSKILECHPGMFIAFRLQNNFIEFFAPMFNLIYSQRQQSSSYYYLEIWILDP